MNKVSHASKSHQNPQRTQFVQPANDIHSRFDDIFGGNNDDAFESGRGGSNFEPEPVEEIEVIAQDTELGEVIEIVPVEEINATPTPPNRIPVSEVELLIAETNFSIVFTGMRFELRHSVCTVPLAASFRVFGKFGSANPSDHTFDQERIEYIISNWQ
jgi:hypothetical protein